VRLFQPFSSAAAAQPPFRLYLKSFNWSSGVYLGATMGLETTADAADATGKVHLDSMATLSFSGCHVGGHVRHWLKMQRELASNPRVFHGKFLWPGFSENMLHVLPNFLLSAISPSQIKESAPWRDFILPLALISRQIGVPATVTKETRS
jgi:Phosphoenolpyruvate carboxykinase C-terminal P-loop domain